MKTPAEEQRDVAEECWAKALRNDWYPGVVNLEARISSLVEELIAKCGIESPEAMSKEQQDEAVGLVLRAVDVTGIRCCLRTLGHELHARQLAASEGN